jgi:hypothetical protein
MEDDTPLPVVSPLRGTALFCSGFRKGFPCDYKAVGGGTVCKSIDCIAMKHEYPSHYQMYASHKQLGDYDNAANWRQTCQAIYIKNNETRLSRIQTESKRLLLAEELQAGTNAASAKTEAEEAERLLTSLSTMTLDELKATQAAAVQEYGFGALPVDPAKEQLDY